MVWSARSSLGKPEAWPFDRCYRALTYAFRVRSNVPQLGQLLGELLAPFETGPRKRVPVYVLTQADADGLSVRLPQGWVRQAASPVGLLDFVLWDVNRAAMAGARGFLALHAGAVSWEDHGVVLPARPGSGKTTLVAGLTQAGFTYLSDEAAPIDLRTGQLHPFARPLTMKPGSVAAIPGLKQRLASELGDYQGPQLHVRPEHLRPGAVGAACRVRYIAFPRYRPGAATRLQPMSRSEAVTVLAENSFNFERCGSRGLRVLGDVVREAECYRLEIGDLESAVRMILGLVRK